MPTLEVIGSTVGDGQATLPDGSVARVDSDTCLDVLPGVRVPLGPSGDPGLFEIGVSGGFTSGDDGWDDCQALLDFRGSF